jgi:predicted nucleic acid-binding protein
MPIVSNTSPILSLSLVGLLELLQIQFTEVNIPSAVYDEFKLDLGYPGTNSISKAIDIGWLKVV